MAESDYDSSKIQVIRTTLSHIRRRPSMYFGSCDARGVLHLVNEVFSNAIDQYLAGQVSEVQLNVEHDVITIADNGPGLPFDQIDQDGTSLAERYLTETRNTPTADGHAPHVHIHNAGFGLACVVFACQSFEVRSWRSGKLWTQVFHKGVRVSKPQVVASGTGRGTIVSFVVDPTIFTAKTPDVGELRRGVFETAHLIPGLRVCLNDETFHSPRGLGDLAAIYHVPNFEAPRGTFALRTTHREVEVNVGLSGAICPASKQIIRSWANGSKTSHHGTHVDGLKRALRACKYKPAVAMIHVLLRQPEFARPTKSHLSNELLVSIVDEAVVPPLKQWLEQCAPSV